MKITFFNDADTCLFSVNCAEETRAELFYFEISKLYFKCNMTTIRELRTKGKNLPNPTLRIPRGPLCIPSTSHTSFLSSLTPPCAHTHVQSRLAHSTGYLGQFSLRYPPGASPLPPAAGTRQVLDTCPWLEQPPPLCSLTSVFKFGVTYMWGYFSVCPCTHVHTSDCI